MLSFIADNMEDHIMEDVLMTLDLKSKELEPGQDVEQVLFDLMAGIIQTYVVDNYEHRR
jgi:hypothetical protein